MSKPKIQITTEAGVNPKGDSYFSAAAYRIGDDGNRTPVLDREERPVELTAGTEEGARARVVKALDDTVIGKDQYELVETFTLGKSVLGGPDRLG